LAVCKPRRIAAWLYVGETSDGVGHRMSHVLGALALAHKHGLGFGGLIRGYGKPVSEQGVDFHRLLDGVFGPGAAKELMFRSDEYKPRELDYFNTKVHQPFAIQFADDVAFESRVHEVQPGYHVSVRGVGLHRSGSSLVGYFPDDFQATLGEHLGERPLAFAPGKLAVAIHVRRGDLQRGDERATCDGYYYRVLDAIREVAPDGDIHLWSSTAGSLMYPDRDRYWSSEDFDGFRDRGITIHLDDEDMLDPWAHMARADLLISSRSFFCYVPALLNRGCIVYPGVVAYAGHRPELPDNWIDALEIEGLQALNDYRVPIRKWGDEDFDEHEMEMMDEMGEEMFENFRLYEILGAPRPPRIRVMPNGEVKFEFDPSSDASGFQRKLRACLGRAPILSV